MFRWLSAVFFTVAEQRHSKVFSGFSNAYLIEFFMRNVEKKLKNHKEMKPGKWSST